MSAERAGPDRPRPARTAGRSSQHEPRRQPGVRRRRQHRRHVQGRLRGVLQRGHRRPSTLAAGHSSTRARRGRGTLGVTNQLTALPAGPVAPGQYVLVKPGGARAGGAASAADVRARPREHVAAPGRSRSCTGQAHARLQWRQLRATRPRSPASSISSATAARTSSRAAARRRRCGHAAAVRKAFGCTETDNNAADFTRRRRRAAGHSLDRFCALRRRRRTVRDVHDTCERRHRCGARHRISPSGSRENVNVTGSWFTISCASSGAHIANCQRRSDRASRSIPTRPSCRARPARSRSSRPR